MRKNPEAPLCAWGAAPVKTLPAADPIRQELKKAAKELEGVQYKAIRLAARLFKVFG